jgi:hypothetical protein
MRRPRAIREHAVMQTLDDTAAGRDAQKRKIAWMIKAGTATGIQPAK